MRRVGTLSVSAIVLAAVIAQPCTAWGEEELAGTWENYAVSPIADESEFAKGGYVLDETSPASCSGGSGQSTSAWDSPGLFEELSFFGGIDGSKQPQDFGVNAQLGGQASMNWGLPLLPQYGVGAQFGTGITATGNAVRVYELLGETTGRTQSFTTLGLFQRLDNGFSWGGVHDFLYENYFDDFFLSQWRTRAAFDLTASDQIGVTAMIDSNDDQGVFGADTLVTLRPITQGHIYWRHYWQTGAQTAFWCGLAEGHAEDNAVTGYSPPKNESFLLGADILAPLSRSFAVFGETNLIMPADTGTVDAFLGIMWVPGGDARRARRGAYSPMMSLAAPTSFAVDLVR